MVRKKFVSPIANPDLLPKGLRSPTSQQSQQEFGENADHDDNNNSSTTPTEEGEAEDQTETNVDQPTEEQNTRDNESEPTIAENNNEEQQNNENVMNDNDTSSNNSETGAAPVETNSTSNDMERDDDNRDERSGETVATTTDEPTENQESETMNTSVDDDAVPQQEEGGIEFEDEEDDIPAKKKSKKSKKSSKKRKRKDDDSEDEDFEQDQEESEEEEEPNADEDESYDNSKEKRRQSKRGSKKRKTADEDSEGKKSKKKRKEATTAIEGAEGMLGDEEDEGYDPSEQNAGVSEGKTSKVSEQFQEILNEIKPRRHTAGQLSQIDDEAAKIADDLLFRMQQAAEDDRHNLKNQQPAMAKIQMLSEVQRTASKVYLQQPLLERGFLSVLADWLKLLPNRQLPNVNLRNVVLDILVQLPIQGDKRVMSKRQREDDPDDDGITKDLLEKSRAIAKCVKMLSTHPKETVENKKKAKGLVERWSRLYYELPDDYSRYAPVPESDNYARSSSSSKPKKINARPRLSEEEEAKIKSSTRARIPQKVNFDFQKRPQSKIDMKGKSVAPPPSVGASSVTSFASPTQRRLAKKFFEMKRR